MPKLKYVGEGSVSILRVGDFVNGMEIEVSGDVARSYEGEEGWEVTGLAPGQDTGKEGE
jgi:hypothetical protein